MTPFRALHLAAEGKGADAHGRTYGEDWPVVPLPECDDGYHVLTTNRVHASEYGELVPGTQRGLARLLAVALNEAFGRRSWAEWSALLDECAKGEPDPEPVEPVICEVCGKPVANHSNYRGDGGPWHHYHATCWRPTDDLPF